MALTKVITGVTDLNQAQSTNGLKFPTGSVFAGTPEEGMIRNDQSQSSETSSSTMQFYNGTAWKNFVNKTPIPLGSDNFNTVLYTGNSSTQAITSVGFQPDFTWIKRRDGTENHYLQDSVRGSTQQIYTNLTNSQFNETTAVTSFSANGFNMGSYNGINNSSETYVAWSWKAGGAPTATNSGGQTPTLGSKIVDGVASTANFATSTSYPLRQSVNSSAGFSITTITKSATNIPLEVPHGLNSPPEFIMLKTTSSSDDWSQWQTAIGTGAYLSTNRNGGADAATAGAVYNFTVVNNDIIRNQWTNAIRSWVCYAWHSVEGYSKMGSYTGNGSATGPTIVTGFEPAFVMIKRTDATANWRILDNKRSTTNPINKELYPNLTNAEGTFSALDFLSNGFQIINTDSSYNASGGTYIYMTFAAT